jgi:hypothetical protein
MGVLNSHRWGRHRPHAKAADVPGKFDRINRLILAAVESCKLFVSRLTKPFRKAAQEASYEVACYREACAHYGEAPSRLFEARRAAGQFYKVLFQEGKDRLHIFSEHDLVVCESCGFTRRAHENKDIEFDVNYSPCAEFRERANQTE